MTAAAIEAPSGKQAKGERISLEAKRFRVLPSEIVLGEQLGQGTTMTDNVPRIQLYQRAPGS